MDAYQPIFDAARIALGSPDIGGAVASAARDAFDVSWQKARLTESIGIIESGLLRPSVLMRPRVFPDGAAWCALYGENIQDGVAGFGDSPAAACGSFDAAWNARLNQGGP